METKKRKFLKIDKEDLEWLLRQSDKDRKEWLHQCHRTMEVTEALDGVVKVCSSLLKHIKTVLRCVDKSFLQLLIREYKQGEQYCSLLWKVLPGSGRDNPPFPYFASGGYLAFFHAVYGINTVRYIAMALKLSPSTIDAALILRIVEYVSNEVTHHIKPLMKTQECLFCRKTRFRNFVSSYGFSKYGSDVTYKPCEPVEEDVKCFCSTQTICCTNPVSPWS